MHLNVKHWFNKCTNYQNGYHWKYFKKETGITKNLCNIQQPCLFLRKTQFVQHWMKKYGKFMD